MKNNKGFTIIEVVLSFAFAIVIIASMFVIVINYQNRTEKEKLISNMKNYKNGVLEIVYQDVISNDIESMETCGSKCLKINTKSSSFKLEAKNDDEGNAYISYKNNNYVLPDSKYNLSEIGDFSYQIDANNKIYKIEIPIIHAELTSEENDENTIKILVSGKEFDKEVNKLDNPTKVITDDITYDGVIHELVTINKLKGNIYYSLTTELNRSNYKTGSTEIPKRINVGVYTVYYYVEESYDYLAKRGSVIISINPRLITYRVDNISKTYDAKVLSQDKVSLISGSLANGHQASFKVSGQITDAGSTTSVLEKVTIYDGNNNDVTSNYSITKVNGTLTVNKRPITVIASSASKVYDGNALTKPSGCESASNLVSGHTATCTNTGSITNVGSANNTLSNVVVKNGNIDVTKNYNITKQNGKLTVTRKGVSKPSTSYCRSLTYNGSYQTLTNTAGEGYSFSGNSQINAGSYTVTAILDNNHKWNDNTTTNHTFNCSIGKKSVTVTASGASKVYDGSPLTKTSGCVGSVGLVSGHTATCTNTGSITNVGSTANTLISVVIKNGNTDVTSNYNITKQNGTLTVTRKGVSKPSTSYCRSLTYNGSYQTLTNSAGTGYSFSGDSQVNAGTYTITATLNGNYQWSDGTTTNHTFNCSIGRKSAIVTASSASKTYDGSALTKTNGCAGTSNLVSGHTATCTNSGSITNAGSTTNTLISVVIKNGNTDVTSNYNITKQNGTLTVTRKGVSKPSTSYCRSLTYNGSYQTLTNSAGTGYSFSGDSQVNAGTYTITASLNGNYQWSDGTTSNHTFNCSIGKKSATVTASSASKTYDGSALTKTSGCAGTSNLVSGHTATCTNSGSITNAGSTTNTLISVVIKNGNTDVTSNYNITKQNGTLTVTRKGVSKPSTSYCRSLTYNGSYQTLTNSAGTGYSFSGNSQVNAGSYTVTATLNGNYQWSDGTTSNHTFNCSIGKKSVTVTASSASKTYDGNALTQTSGCAGTSNLVSGHTATCTNTGSITNVGSTTNTLSSVVIKNGNTDVTSNYNITKETGTLTVTKKSVTYKANSATKTYDGTALTSQSATLTSGSLVSGHTATFSITGSQTSAGSSTNTLNSVTIKSGNTDVTRNYSIATENGTLTVTRKSVTIPTADNYCNTGLTYNGSAQTLTKTAGGGYTFSGNSKTNAGSYTVTATLNSNYTWSDNTTETKTLTCSISKATPTVTVSADSVSLNSGTTTTFTEYANIAGSFTNTSGSTNATVSPSSYSGVAANTAQTVTISGVSQGSSTITVSFTPTDTVNYNTTTSTVNVTIKASCAWIKHWKSNGNTYSQCTAETQPSDPKPGDTYITCESYHGGKFKFVIETFTCGDGKHTTTGYDSDFGYGSASEAVSSCSTRVSYSCSGYGGISSPSSYCSSKEQILYSKYENTYTCG